MRGGGQQRAVTPLAVLESRGAAQGGQQPRFGHLRSVFDCTVPDTPSLLPSFIHAGFKAIVMFRRGESDFRSRAPQLLWRGIHLHVFKLASG